MQNSRWLEIEKIFYQAIEHPVDARAEFLEKVCAGNRDLFLEVSSLLSSHDESGDFLNEPDFSLGLRVFTEKQYALVIGQRFANYKILNFLGSGGMGEVYLAQDSLLNRLVALKLLPAALTANADRVNRFRQESKIASLVAHPNIARVYQVGEIEGSYFIAMEFVEGITLRRRFSNAALTPDEILRIAGQIIAGLTAAHQAGVIHRDLKPENIILQPDGQVKIVDFSLAKLTRPAFVNSPAETAVGGILTNPINTEPGLLIGTAGYMSPEQARGQETDHRTDVWSFGALLYEMLAGEQPFRGATAMDTIAMILTVEPSPLIPNPSPLHKKLCLIAEKCLRKNPEQRYQTIREIQADLEKPVADFSLQKTPDVFERSQQTLEELKRKFTKRSLIATASVIIAVFTAFYFALQWKAPTSQNAVSTGNAQLEIKSIAILPFKSMNTAPEENFEIGMAEALINRLGSLGQFTVRPTGAVKKFARMETNPIEAGQELKVDAVIDGNIQKDGETLRVSVQMIDVREGKLLWSEEFDSPITGIFKMQETISSRVAHSLLPKLFGGQKNLFAVKYEQNSEAYRAYLKGQFHADREVEEEMVKAAKFYRQAIEVDPMFAPAYVGLANHFNENFGEARFMTYSERVEKARELVLKALQIDETLANAHVTLGTILMTYNWNWAEAEKAFKRAIELNPNLARAHHSYAYYLVLTGQYNEAIAAIHRAQEIDPVSIRVARDVGSIYIFARRCDDAEAAFRSANEMDRELLSIHMNLGAVYQCRKDYARAAEEFQKAARVKADYLDAYASMGQVYGLMGQKNKALKMLAEMKRVAAGRTIWSFYMIKIYSGIGDKDKAFEWIEKGIQRRDIGAQLKADPYLDTLRDDPRYGDFVRRVGFPR